MKHLKIYEEFKKYYHFDAIKFYNDFKKIFNKERDENINFRSTDFFKNLDKLLPTWSTTPLDKTVEQFVKDLLQDKEIEFVDLAGDINFGRVKNSKFFYSVFSKEFTYSIDLYGSLKKYGYPEDKEDYVAVDYSIPIKIYGEPTKIEEIVDLYLKINKYNI